MGLRELILLSLAALPLSLGAETASDYLNRGAQKYIFGHEAAAKAEVDEGLRKFPNDPELQGMLKLFKEKPPQEQKNEDKNKKDNQDQSQKDSSKAADQNKDQDKNKDRNKPSPTPTPDENQKQKGAEETPTPTPGSSPSEGDEASPSPTPGEDFPTPTPSPGNENGSSNGEGESPTPAGTPSKPLTGEVKGAGEEKPQGTPAGEIAEAEPEKEGEMSPKQAAALLESMKDEEQKVQLDEHRRVLPVYKDW